MNPKMITFSSDFEKQSQGIGNMEAVIYGIAPDAKVIQLMHGIEGFSIISAARAMETVYHLPVGIHVCVVDPGVGTSRKGLIVKVKRGDYFVGPDNGCLMTAPRFLGGIEKIVSIENEKYILKPISPIFHGRHVFAPVAAHLASGIAMGEFGPELKKHDCVAAPYDEAKINGSQIEAIVININHFGSINLNIMSDEFDLFGPKFPEKFELIKNNKAAVLHYAKTFGDVKQGEALIMKDDYQRVEVAINQGSFIKKVPLKLGERVTIRPL